MRICSAKLTGAKLPGAYLEGADLTEAGLVHAKLPKAHLKLANLTKAGLGVADLTEADLNEANLTEAGLDGAKLIGADLTDANLTGANLTGANLSGDVDGAKLTAADLTGAKLPGAKLTGAKLNGANLTNADLTGANLTKTGLAYVTLTNAMYAPVSAPPDPYVAGIKGLETLNTAVGEQIGLVQLRKLLQDAGLRDAEREATSAIQRNITRDRFSSPWQTFAWIEGILRFVGFDVTTAYGLYPWRALSEILGLGGLFTCVYFWLIWLLRQDPGSGSGIFQVFPADRIKEATAEPTLEKDAKVIRVDAVDA